MCNSVECSCVLFRCYVVFFFFKSRRRHTRCLSDWSSDVCSSDLLQGSRYFPRSSGHSPRRVPPHQCRQTFFLVVAEIPGILQQQPTAALECHLLLLT